MSHLELHPLALLLPPMTEREYAALRDDIAAHGQREPVLTYQGRIVDGRHRAQACAELGIDVHTREHDGDEHALLAVVIAANVHRRHLSQSQRAVIALTVERDTNSPGRSAEHAARTVGVSSAYVKRARRLQLIAPDLLARVVSDPSYGLPDAEREHARRQRLAVPALDLTTTAPPEVLRYSVVLADPPWQHTNTFTSPKSKTGGAASYYETMLTADIAALTVWDRPVSELFADDAYLLMWCTNSHLPDALDVIAAWGCRYLGLLTWAKVKDGRPQLGTGVHLRGCTEQLIIAAHGRPRPADRSIPTLLTAPRRAHSVKPDGQYDIAERLMPAGPYVELFARRTRDGWHTWGNAVAA